MARVSGGQSVVGIRRAFTMVELLLVLAVLLVIAGIAYPSLSAWQQRLPLERAAFVVRNELLQARVAAIETAKPFYFEYRPGDDEFRTCHQPGTPRPNAARRRLKEGIRFARRGQTGGPWATPIHFQPDGTAVDATITIVDTNGHTATITVSRLTGSVRIAPAS